MSVFQAGFGKVEITPHHWGFPLMGYGNRVAGASGAHDPLWAKAVVVDDGVGRWALCSVDMCWISADSVAKIREKVGTQTTLTPESILVCATHTHSGPHDTDAGNWDQPFVNLITEAIVQAWQSRQPAKLAVGAGFLYGHSLNRRWFDRPVDPSVGVLRIDSMTGDLLGIVSNFACHPVVLGYDNLLASADFVGYASSLVEDTIGGMCIFTNGGCGDVNPLTETVRQQRTAKQYFVTMAPEATYYGHGSKAVAIGDRGGGTFAEAEIIGQVLGAEICYVAQGLETQAPVVTPWSRQVWVNRLDDGEALIETQALGVGDFALVAQPGEVFVETALEIKASLRQRNYLYPWLVSYANDWQYYLVPETAFPEAGYEVDWATKLQHSSTLQDRLITSILNAIDETKSP
ncbi:MAG: neutral/alkaline non-lysosomal ceramidase N-terminal domain-containing protein [Chloroflexota bacterium]